MNNEPVLTVGTITAIVSAALLLLIAFGVPLSNEQQKAILGFVAVIAPIVAAVITRRHVTPTAKTLGAHKADVA